MRQLRFLLLLSVLIMIILVGCEYKRTGKESSSLDNINTKLNNKNEIVEVNITTEDITPIDTTETDGTATNTTATYTTAIDPTAVDRTSKQLMNYLNIDDESLITFIKYSVNHNYIEYLYDHNTYAVNIKDYTILKYTSNPEDPLGGCSYKYYKETCEVPGILTKQYAKIYNKQYVTIDGTKKENVAAQYIMWLPEMEETSDINNKINQKLKQYNQEIVDEFDIFAKEYLEDEDLLKSITSYDCIPAADVYNLDIKYYVTWYDDQRVSFLIKGHDYEDWQVTLSFSTKTGEMLKSNIGPTYRDINKESTNKKIAKRKFTLKEDHIINVNYNIPLTKEDYKISSEFNLVDIDYYEDCYLLDMQKMDVTGDKIDDTVLMTGVHLEVYSDPYYDNITIIIQDGKNNKLMFLQPQNAYGYSYGIFMGDFNGDQVKDILVSMNNSITGGAGQYTFSIYSFNKHQFKMLFNNNKIYDETKFTVDFMDNFKIKIFSPQTNYQVMIDKSDEKEGYKILYQRNKLIEKVNGSIDNFCNLIPEDIDKDGILELKGIQYVSGYGHADGIGMGISILKYNLKKQKWIVQDFEFEEF